MKLRAAPLLLALLAGGSSAQALFRCGNMYSQVECPGAQVVGKADAPSAARVAEARQDAERARRLAADMERDRLRREASIRPALAASLSPTQRRAAETQTAASRPGRTTQRRARTADEHRDFVAAVPGSGRKR